jgi:hypothetical protein
MAAACHDMAMKMHAPELGFVDGLDAKFYG